MPAKFENPEEKKVQDQTGTDGSPRESIDRAADKAAEKAAKDEQRYDKAHDIMSK